jgi:hypothetical protein
MANEDRYEGRPFSRKIEVLIYPVNELVGRTLKMNKENAIRLFSDGTQDTLRISFHVEQNILTVPGFSSIKLYNLTPQTRLAISTPGAWRCEINVGTETMGMQEIYSGAVIKGITEKIGPDVITTLWCHANFIERMTSFQTRTWRAFSPIQDVLKDCAKELGVKWDASRVDIPNFEIGSGGFAFAGLTKDALDKLAFQYGFSWTISNDCLQVLQDGKSFPRAHSVSYKNNVLMSAIPSLDGPMKIMYAVLVKAYMNPMIWAGDYIVLESSVNSDLNGSWLVHSINFDGSTFSDEWMMTMDCKVRNPQSQEWGSF